MIAVLFGLFAAITNGAQAVINKGLTARYPARQLIGALYVTNCLILLPFAPFSTWTWSAWIVVLHLVSVALMVITAIAVTLGQVAAYRILVDEPYGERARRIAIAILVLMGVAFVVFTWAPPRIFLFENFAFYRYSGEFGILQDYTPYLVFK